MIDYARLAYRVEPMTTQDVDAVMEIEQEAFSAPWSARAYGYELHYNANAYYCVAGVQDGNAPPYGSDTPRRQSLWQRLFRRIGAARIEMARAPLVGYGGFWTMVDEAHISTLAVHSAWRRRGIGELLLLAMLDRAAEVGVRVATLEVRASNAGAQSLYREYGFEVFGERRHYYSDNGEDALIMTTPPLTSASFQRHIQELKTSLYPRLSR